MSTTSSIVSLLYSGRWYTACVLVGSYFVQVFRVYRRLSHVKGPWAAQFSDAWLLGVIYRQRAHYEFYDVRKKYGTLARIGPNTLITSDIDQVTRMNAPRSAYVRGDWYLGFRLAPGVDNCFSLRDEKAHTKRRAQMNLAYTGREDINFEPNIDIHVLNFIRLITVTRHKTKYLSSRSEVNIIDLAQKAQYFTIDVITDLATGAPLGDLNSDADQHHYLRTTMEAQPAFAIVGVVPSVNKFIQIPFVGKRLFPTSQDEIGMGKMIGIAQKNVAERFDPSLRNKFEKPDILQSFINHDLTQEETVSESLLLILGGSDTTASAIRATMLCILTSPQTYRTLQAEIDSSTLSSPVVREEEARRLVYLQAVILEGLRMHPPTGGLLSKLTPPGGDMINGLFIPGGVNIATNTWALMRSKDIFGPDVDCFRPERWLNVSEAKYAEMARVVDMTFGSGRFKCLGRAVAWIELNKIFVELLRNFEWAVVDPTDPWKSANLGIIVHREFYVRVTERAARK